MLAADWMHGHPGDDAGDAADRDIALRLAAWLTAVSTEASGSTPGQRAPAPLPAGRATLTTPRRVR